VRSPSRKSLSDEEKQVAVEWRARFKFVALLSLYGLLSGLITAALVFPFGRNGSGVLGGVFGAIMAVVLVGCGMLRALWKIILLPSVTAATFYFSFMLGGPLGVGLSMRSTMSEAPTITPLAMFPGGVIGGFIVLAAITILVRPNVGFGTLAVKTVIGSLVGGILGVIGWSLGPSLGMEIWSGVHYLGLTAPAETFWVARDSDTIHAYSLFVVWQTGMALVLAITLLPSEQSPAKLVQTT
jgi:hypothetical protein